MNVCFKAFVVAVGVLAVLAPVPGVADDDRLRATLSGFNEVLGPNLGIGAIFSTGSGRIKLRIDKHDREIHFELSYTFPDAADTTIIGTQFVNQAHLHFGQRHTTGGITVWLCESADSPAPATVADDVPPCPSPDGKVTGTIRPRDVIALTAQGLPGGEDGFDALLAALRAGAVYANVHTDRFAPGEIRAQLDEEDDD